MNPKLIYLWSLAVVCSFLIGMGSGIMYGIVAF